MGEDVFCSLNYQSSTHHGRLPRVAHQICVRSRSDIVISCGDAAALILQIGQISGLMIGLISTQIVNGRQMLQCGSDSTRFMPLLAVNHLVESMQSSGSFVEVVVESLNGNGVEQTSFVRPNGQILKL